MSSQFAFIDGKKTRVHSPEFIKERFYLKDDVLHYKRRELPDKFGPKRNTRAAVSRWNKAKADKPVVLSDHRETPQLSVGYVTYSVTDIWYVTKHGVWLDSVPLDQTSEEMARAARDSFIRKPKKEPEPKLEKTPKPKAEKSPKPKVSLPTEISKVKFRDKTQIKAKDPEPELPEGVLVTQLAPSRWEAKISWQGSIVPLGYYKEKRPAIDACTSALNRRRKKNA